jgi:hypothetical protein
MHLHQVAAATPRVRAYRGVAFQAFKARILSNGTEFSQDRMIHECLL